VIDGCRVADIGLEIHRRYASLGQFIGHGGGFRRHDIGYGNGGAGLAESMGERPTDALAAARHERSAALQTEAFQYWFCIKH
jgi:hypothetical protein